MSISLDNEAILHLLFRTCDSFGVDPQIPEETEEYLAQLLAGYQGTLELPAIEGWLNVEIPRRFRALEARPRWIQGAHWPFNAGEPMIFAGQLDLKAHGSDLAASLFHDATSLYVFIARDAGPVVITQRY